VVPADLDVDGGVELDARHLRAGEQPPHVDVVDGVAGDHAERGAEAADDAGLFAVRNGVVADDVVADVFLGPGDRVGMGPLDGLDVAFGRIGRSIVKLVAVFPERNAGADRVADDVVLDDPAFAPVRADQADLLGCRRRPGRGCMAHREAAHGDEVPSRLVGIEHGPADVDFDQLLVRVRAGELRPDRCLVLVHLGEPLGGAFHVLVGRRGGSSRGLEHVFPCGRLDQPVAVQVHRAGMVFAALAVEPVAADQVAVRIEALEKGIGQRHLPDIALDLHPVLDDFGAFDFHLLARRGLIDDPLCVGLAAARRIDAFPVDALMHSDHVARLRQFGGALDRAQRRGLRAGVGVVAAGGDMELGGAKGGGQGEGAGQWDQDTSHVIVLS